MNDPLVGIRRLTPADAAAYRDLRLEALRRDPEAFGSTFEVENTRPLSWFAERLGTSYVLGAFADGALCGIAGFVAQAGLKQAHKGTLWGMYVRPQARNVGLGRRLGMAIIALAREHVELIQLSVVSENETARRLYARLGFVEYGLERSALKHNGRYYDDVLMAKDLSGRLGVP